MIKTGLRKERTEKQSREIWDDTRRRLGVNPEEAEHDPWLKQWRNDNREFNATHPSKPRSRTR